MGKVDVALIDSAGFNGDKDIGCTREICLQRHTALQQGPAFM
jgi:hypothetical protein